MDLVSRTRFQRLSRLGIKRSGARNEFTALEARIENDS